MSRLQLLGAAVVLAMCGYIATAQSTVTNVFGGINRAVPDGQTTGMSDTRDLRFADPFFANITSLQVTLTLANGFNGDLYGYLRHGDGFSVLLNRVGRTAADDTGYGDAGMSLTFSAGGYDIHEYQSHSPVFDGDQLTGTWAPDGRETDPAYTLDTDSRTALLDSFNGINPNGEWTLFLSDLDFGEESTLVQWGLVITAIPEPSSGTLSVLGGLAVLAHSLRRRRSV
jgi:hypothetical protein